MKILNEEQPLIERLTNLAKIEERNYTYEEVVEIQQISNYFAYKVGVQ